MNNKEELKKQLILLSFILVIAIIVAILLNSGKSKHYINEVSNTNSNIIQNEKTDEKKLLENLKGLLEETEDEKYIEEPVEGTKETITTTKERRNSNYNGKW